MRIPNLELLGGIMGKKKVKVELRLPGDLTYALQIIARLRGTTFEKLSEKVLRKHIDEYFNRAGKSSD